MKRAEAKTFLMLTLPVLAVIVFAGLWNWRSERLAERDVKNVRVIECVVVPEPEPYAIAKKWREQEQRAGKRIIEGIPVSPLGQDHLPTMKNALKKGHCRFRVKFYLPIGCRIFSVQCQAQDLKTGQIFQGAWRQRSFERNQLIHEEIFNFFPWREKNFYGVKNPKVNFSAELLAYDGRKRRRITTNKIVDVTKF